jgi:hypothetical protein
MRAAASMPRLVDTALASTTAPRAVKVIEAKPYACGRSADEYSNASLVYVPSETTDANFV